MKICVFGLWHLGTVTSACLADLGFQVTGLDLDEVRIHDLQRGEPPIHEPGLQKLIADNLNKDLLKFTYNPQEALENADVMWVTIDTPVDEDDRADLEFVTNQIKLVMEHINENSLIVISSQVPVGFTNRIEQEYKLRFPQKQVKFAYSPENLRLGKSVHIFENPDRIVVGIREESDRSYFEPLFTSICNRIEWMKTESAEMTKHAINAFLALSVSFANELATICEHVGANAKEVERGLKTEERIGLKAYLSPGAAFAGGTLARDIHFLSDLGKQHNQPAHLINSVKVSNDFHKTWIQRKIITYIGELKGKSIGVLGLTYKPGTDTLRRSLSVELCSWLSKHGASVKAFDPQVIKLPEELNSSILLKHNIKDCLDGIDALILATEWPLFREGLKPEFISSMKQKNIIDMNGFLEKNLEGYKDLRYATVGRG